MASFLPNLRHLTIALAILLGAGIASGIEVTPTLISQKLNPPYAAGNTDVLFATFTPDGSRTLYVQSGDGTQIGTLYSVTGPGATPVALLPSIQVNHFNVKPAPFTVTPDGDRVVAISDGALVSVPVVGGPVAMLGTPSGPFAISPDSSTVAFVTDTPEPPLANPAEFSSIVTVPIAGGTQTPLPGAVKSESWLTFSGSGQNVYVLAAPSDSALPPIYIYFAPADGSAPAALISTDPAQPGLPQQVIGLPMRLADGSAIVYATAGDFFSSEVRKVTLDTNESSTLFVGRFNAGVILTLSEDSSTAFVTEQFGTLHAIDIETGATTLLAENIANALGAGVEARLTPDRSTAVFKLPGGLFARSMDGAPAVELSATGVVELEVTSIVGVTATHAVFFGRIDGGLPNLFSSRLDGTALQRLHRALALTEAIEADAQLTLDGSHVLFRGDLIRGGEDYIFRVPVGGGLMELIHQGARNAQDVDFMAQNPNGSGVAFIADLRQNSVDELFFETFDDGNLFLNPLSDPGDGDGRLSSFAISPDSRHVVYLANQFSEGDAELVSIRIAGGLARRLNPFPNQRGDVRTDFKITADSLYAVFRADTDVDTVSELYSSGLDEPNPFPTKLHPDLPIGQDIKDFAVSPDGRYVAMRGDVEFNTRQELYLAPIDGSSFIKISPPLTEDRDVEQGYVFSPDSKTIVFRSEDVENEVRLHSYEIATGERTRLQDFRVPFRFPSQPEFGPDGTTLTFVASLLGNSRRLLRTSDGQRIVDLGRSWNIFPNQFSSDGSRFIWTAGARTIDAVDTKNGAATEIFAVPEGFGISQFIVTPVTDRLVVFAHGGLAGFDISSFALDGSDPMPILSGNETPPVLRTIQSDAAGRTLVFDLGGQLYLTDLFAGTPAEPIARGIEIRSGIDQYHITPDGSEVCFAGRPVGTDQTHGLFLYERGSGSIVTVRAAGGPDSGADYMPETTPDGRQLIYVSEADNVGIRELFATRPGTLYTLLPEQSDADAIEPVTLPALTDTLAPEAILDSSHWIGLRYDGLPLAPNLEVHSANLIFTASADTTGTRELLIRVQGAAAPLLFQDGAAFDINARPPSPLPPVVWPLGTWTAGQSSVSPHLDTLLGYVAGLPDWQAGNPLAFTILSRGGDGSAHRAWMHEGDPTLAPRLEITVLEDLRGQPLARLGFIEWATRFAFLVPNPDDDSDGDGLTLAAEYTLGLNPRKRDPSPAPGIALPLTAPATITFTRHPTITGATVTVESSRDFVDWNPIATTISGAPAIALDPGVEIAGETPMADGTTNVAITVADPARRQFYRFRASVP